ncbi:THUMP domain-containing protein [Forsythia ovata]|uniref:THUMP domain-containing protein n=1 Tax=Forsythia ovata TaxID=205694 RepID=A0ABD1VEQ2_9LAMI
MATENKSKPNNPNKTDKRRKQYLPHNRPVKKGIYALRPGVQGFFITCDGGRERQASNEAINVIDSEDDISCEKQAQKNKEKSDDQEVEAVEPPVKKQCIENDASKCRNGLSKKVEKKSVDRLIEAELAELGDRSKRRFSNLDSGCNGVVFVQMRKRDGDPCPKDIIQHMMTSLASTRKHVSRFLLRVLPIEITCYASDEEIRRAIKPVIEQFFPEETQNPLKFAVIYDARANTGVDRTKIIDAVAKSVPSAHKVDLGNPDVSIVVQIVKTMCLIGIVEKYKELAKYNVRELTSPK